MDKVMTENITHKVLDYWFDKTIDNRVPNTREKIEIDSQLNVHPVTKEFISDMTVLLHGAWGSNNNHTFCKIQIKSSFVFKTDNLKTPMVTESIWLFLKQQYQLAINIFRQNHFGELTLACRINAKAIDKEVYEALKSKYAKYLFFPDEPPFGDAFNPYQ